MQINTKFDIDQSVVISEIGLVARIVEIRQDGRNLWYKCQYWMEGKVFFIDLNEDELELGSPKRCGI